MVPVIRVSQSRRGQPAVNAITARPGGAYGTGVGHTLGRSSDPSTPALLFRNWRDTFDDVLQERSEGRDELQPPSDCPDTCPIEQRAIDGCRRPLRSGINHYSRIRDLSRPLPSASRARVRQSTGHVGRGTITIRKASRTEERLIRAAADLVLENHDALTWARCLYTDRISDSKYCLLGRFTGAGNLRVDVEDSFWSGPYKVCGGGPEARFNFTARANKNTNRINICRPSRTWQALLRSFESGDQAIRECAVMRTARLLVHESAHLCYRAGGLTHNSEGGPRDCDGANRIENMFWWAITRRYGDTRPVADSCRHDDAVFCSNR